MATLTAENILGYQIVNVRSELFVRHIAEMIDAGCNAAYFVCANPHSLEVARADAKFEAAMREATHLVPDGSGIVFASMILGGRLRERITGSDVFLGLSRVLNRKGGYSYFFLGSTEENLEAIRSRMSWEFPNIHVSGYLSPAYKSEFTAEEESAMVEAINRAQPDVLWVGMTAPKQEKWIHRNRERLQVRFIGPIGAVFDFYTGRIKRSHPVFQKLGLEWLPRFAREPRRLWRRNLVSTPRFIGRVFLKRIHIGGRAETRDASN